VADQSLRGTRLEFRFKAGRLGDTDAMVAIAAVTVDRVVAIDALRRTGLESSPKVRGLSNTDAMVAMAAITVDRVVAVDTLRGATIDETESRSICHDAGEVDARSIGRTVAIETADVLGGNITSRLALSKLCDDGNRHANPVVLAHIARVLAVAIDLTLLGPVGPRIFLTGHFSAS
jgi:hypothetical protein